ncbi:MAG: helix-turn-helix transcriptional regulator [Candidatus Firestonebacteria bacterium]
METTEIYKYIGKIIRNERNKRGMTLEQLAEKTQRDWSYLSQIERGKNVPSIETLVRICEALTISLSNLFAFHKPVVIYKVDPYINKISNIIRAKSVEDKKVAFNILSQVFKKKSKY